MLTALDTNILVYAEGVNGPTRKIEARAAMRRLEPNGIVIPVQVLGELFNVLSRKAKRPAHEADASVRRWSRSYRLAETSPSVMSAALDLSVSHQLAIWDAVIVSAALDAGCRELLSEDMQAGFAWRGVAIRNPFAA